LEIDEMRGSGGKIATLKANTRSQRGKKQRFKLPSNPRPAEKMPKEKNQRAAVVLKAASKSQIVHQSP